jgi:nuclear pore complex protein Nup133
MLLVEFQEVAAREGVTGEELLSPGKLVDACLKSGSRELVMGAFEVFTNAGAKFCSSNYNLLEQAWLRAADQDDWVGLKKTSDEEPWSDDHLLEALQGTLLYQASKHFFGEAGMILPRFDQGFPNQIGVTADSAEAVESVLAKHPSYTYAGQIMLTAFRMGTSLHASLDERDADTMVDL